MAAEPNQSTTQKQYIEHQLSLCGAPLEGRSPAAAYGQYHRQQHTQQRCLKSKQARLQCCPTTPSKEKKAVTKVTAASQRVGSSFRKSLPLSFTTTQTFAPSSQGLLQVVSRRAKQLQKPGTYLYTPCGCACSKHSVLQNHIQLHTGERPYPCTPCDLSFKTKRNLYKHRRSRTHHTRSAPAVVRTPPGLSRSGNGLQVADQVKEDQVKGSETMTSEGESSLHGCTSSTVEEHEQKLLQEMSAIPTTSGTAAQGIKGYHPPDGAHAVKQRLALRLSERMHAPMGPSDEATSFMESWNKGSTESGYFSRSESGDWSQASPPSTEGKSYAEIILGKFGRIDQRYRSPLQQWHASSDPVERRRSIPKNVPTTQVIEHITKLITINEALVDTKEIDSVKPRRSSLSRKNSAEVSKVSAPKLPSMFHTKGEAPGSSSMSSVDLGLSREPLHPRFCRVDLLSGRPYPAPLVRSHSMPSPAGMVECPVRRFRTSHSFDEQQALPTGKKVGRPHGILRRQPALEVSLEPSLEPEVTIQEMTQYQSSTITMVTSPWESQHRGPREQEGKTYIPGCGGQEVLKTHGSQLVIEPDILKGVAKEDVSPQTLQQEENKVHAVALQKVQETCCLPPTSSYTQGEKGDHTMKGEVLQSQPDGRSTGKVISVIQHTSAFEKRGKVFSVFSANKDCRTLQKDLPKSCSYSYQVHQLSIQVPKGGTDAKPRAVNSGTFQWPKRSSTLAQLPTEKLPPKKKCLRLAETGQFSGEPSLKSMQNNSAWECTTSFTSNLPVSTTYNKIPQADTKSLVATVPSNSQMAHQMSMLPYSHQTQTLPSPSYVVQAADTWSKSCPSTQSSSPTWSPSRMCQLMRHPTCVAPLQEETSSCQISKAVILQVCSPNADQTLFVPKLSSSPVSSTEVRRTEASSKLSPATTPSEPLAKTSVEPVTSKTKSKSLVPPLSHFPVSSSFYNPPAATESRLLVQPVLTFLSLNDLSVADAVLRPTPLKLQIPVESDQQNPKPLHSPSQGRIPVLQQYLSLSETCRPTNRLAVPVRTQTVLPKYSSALYTTRTQRTLDENCLNLFLACPNSNVKAYQLLTPPPLTASQPESEERGKRALSPAGSLEFDSEMEHQEKRAKRKEQSDNNDKESEDGWLKKHEAGETDSTLSIEPPAGWKEEDNGREQEENVKECCEQSGTRKTKTLEQEISQKTTLNTMGAEHNPYLCLHTATSVSWCLLEHSNLSNQRGVPLSVCSNQSDGMPTLHPVGLSTRVALSLLHSKQRKNPEVYTIATTPQPASTELLLARKPQTSEGAEKVSLHPKLRIHMEHKKRIFRESWRWTLLDTVKMEGATVCTQGGKRSRGSLISRGVPEDSENHDKDS